MTTMRIKRILKYLGIACVSLIYTGCSLPTSLVQRAENKKVPSSYNNSQDSINAAKTKWKDFFTDPNLIALIDTALNKNQELNIILQEINIAKNEIRGRKGAYLPFVGVGVGAGLEKVGRYTSQGASDDANYITPGQKVPVNLPNYAFGLNASWEV